MIFLEFFENIEYKLHIIITNSLLQVPAEAYTKLEGITPSNNTFFSKLYGIVVAIFTAVRTDFSPMYVSAERDT